MKKFLDQKRKGDYMNALEILQDMMDRTDIGKAFYEIDNHLSNLDTFNQDILKEALRHSDPIDFLENEENVLKSLVTAIVDRAMIQPVPMSYLKTCVFTLPDDFLIRAEVVKDEIIKSKERIDEKAWTYVVGAIVASDCHV